MVHYVAKLFEKVGNDNEAIRWIKKFASDDKTFAVLKVSGASLQKHAEEIAQDLLILSKLDLTAPIIYGWGDALTKKLADNGITSLKHEATGLRITREADLEYLRQIVEEQANLIISNLDKTGTHSKLLYDVFVAHKKELEGVDGEHYTGEIIDVNTKPIIDCLRKRIIPIIPPIGYDYEGSVLNINADTAARALVLALQPKRYIILTNTGGVLDKEGNIISKISLGKDYDALTNNNIIDGGMKLKIDEVKETIEQAPEEYVLEIQIASPQNLLKELFTDVGSGTFISL